MYYKTYICSNCFHMQKRYKKVKCESCKSEMFHCDEWIAPTIALLNRKGYKTAYCCSGHPVSITKYSDWQPLETYILFEEGTVSKFKNLPNGFNVCNHNPNAIRWQVIEYGKMRLPSRLDYEHHEVIFALAKVLGNLHKWALDLPDLKE